MTPVRIAPSILAADLLRLGEQIEAVERGAADRIHLDVMDGLFVPNISFGLPIAHAVRRVTQLPVEAHLMIVQPERGDKGADRRGCGGWRVVSSQRSHTGDGGFAGRTSLM